MSFVDDACAKIADNPQFMAEYNLITRNSVLDGMGIFEKISIREEALRRLMQSAALFSLSSNPEWKRIAYRICIGALSYGNELTGIKDAIRLTLTRLKNFPAVDFAFHGSITSATFTPTVFYEIISDRADNTIKFADRTATLTRMQLSVWQIIKAGTSLALSAPTSAGKSFVFQAFVESSKKQNGALNILYIVPSRALLTQVTQDLRSFVRNKEFSVSNVPIIWNDEKTTSPIYVLTPERLQILLQTSSDFSFDIAVIDEAHLIGEGSRGIILFSVLQELVSRMPKMQVLFSSPQIRDPGVFGSLIRQQVEVIKEQESPVAQNIIKLRGDAANTTRLLVFLWEKAAEELLIEVKTIIPVYNAPDRLVYASWFFGTVSQSLVYAEGPASCEDIAIKIQNLFRDTASILGSSDSINEETLAARKELSQFAKETVHPTYLLAETVMGGIGFHYGRIPSLLRNAIEKCFSDGYLSHIVCTSTLLQGVNLPARNIFMYNPHKGEGNPIDSVSFWNLAGRAGRLGRDFQGNVFLIDYDEWHSSPLSGPKDEPIKASLNSVLVEEYSGLLEYIDKDDIPSGEKPLYEASFAKLLRDFRKGRLGTTFGQLSALAPDIAEKVQNAVASANARITLPIETLDQNPQISAYRQQGLYDYMLTKIKKEGPDYLIPLHPSSDWKNALDKLRPVFARVHKYIELKGGNHHRYWAPLALRWMRGDPLPRVIDDAIKYHARQGRRRNNRTIIREVLTDIETGLRFRYVNLLGCYNAVLQEALKASKFESYCEKIPALPLYLELGAASGTMIELMSLGLSRHTANIVANLTINRDMDQSLTRDLIRRLDVTALGLSDTLREEIRRIKQII